MGGSLLVACLVMALLSGSTRAAADTEPGRAPVQAAGIGRAAPAPPGAGVVAPGAEYAWPLAPVPAVRTPFQKPTHLYGPGHRGVDLAGRSGQPVLAAREGVVVFAGSVAGRGVVSVQHPDALRTTYEPVTSTVHAGAAVQRGDVLGLLEPGHPGCAVPTLGPASDPSVPTLGPAGDPSACLHWGARRDRLVYVDPLVLLKPPRVRLLPVPDPWPNEPS